jgi:predicted  nucleic acid-binding Zn-ribbon protein
MPRQLMEFQCTNCQKVFDFKLNTSLNGNYRIHCPNCGHIHYRTVKDGKITDQRFPENDSKILIEDIVPTKSSCRDVTKEKREDHSFDGKGFLHRLWKEKFSEAIAN